LTLEQGRSIAHGTALRAEKNSGQVPKTSSLGSSNWEHTEHKRTWSLS